MEAKYSLDLPIYVSCSGLNFICFKWKFYSNIWLLYIHLFHNQNLFSNFSPGSVTKTSHSNDVLTLHTRARAQYIYNIYPLFIKRPFLSPPLSFFFKLQAQCRTRKSWIGHLRVHKVLRISYFPSKILKAPKFFNIFLLDGVRIKQPTIMRWWNLINKNFIVSPLKSHENY